MNEDASGLIHVVNDGECSWYEFAKATFDLTKTRVPLEPQSTAATKRRATRPERLEIIARIRSKEKMGRTLNKRRRER